MSDQARDAAFVAARIGKTENWVKRNAHRLPHHKFGRTYAFTDADIAAILAAAARNAAGPAPAEDDDPMLPSSAARRRRP